MASDEVQGERRRIVSVEIGPIHGDDDLLAWADDFPHPGREYLPDDDASIAQQPIDLFDGVLVDEAARLRQRMADDRDSQRSAGHDAERAVGKGFSTLGVQALVEYPVEKVSDKFSAIDLRFHGSVWDAIRHPYDSAAKLGRCESLPKMRGFLRCFLINYGLHILPL